jgi:hypothetical protein
MAIELREVKTKKDFKEFIYLPEKIHKGHDKWLYPIYFDEEKLFNPQKNASFRVCDYKMVLAYKDGEAVGRIMGIINRQHNELFNLKNARFGFLECYEDSEVSHALISDIENWGREQGMNKIIGPFGFSDKEVQGLLIEGFEYEPVIDSACNFEFLPKLVEAEGYTKELDCVIYRFPVVNPVPEVMNRIFDRVTSRKDIQFIEFTKNSQMKPYILSAMHLVNESFKDIYGFIPMTEEEMMKLAKQYLPLLDPRFVKMVVKDGEVIAFSASMPNMYKGIQKAKGRLFPFGVFHILRAIKKARAVNIMLGAVKPSYQKQALDLFLTLGTIRSVIAAGMDSVDTHVVMEENKDMMAEFKRFGAFLIKRFRVYQKAL